MTKYKVASVSSQAEAEYIAVRLEKLLGFSATVSEGSETALGLSSLRYVVHVSIPRNKSLARYYALKATRKP